MSPNENAPLRAGLSDKIIKLFRWLDDLLGRKDQSSFVFCEERESKIIR